MPLRQRRPPGATAHLVLRIRPEKRTTICPGSGRDLRGPEFEGIRFCAARSDGGGGLSSSGESSFVFRQFLGVLSPLSSPRPPALSRLSALLEGEKENDPRGQLREFLPIRAEAIEFACADLRRFGRLSFDSRPPGRLVCAGFALNFSSPSSWPRGWPGASPSSGTDQEGGGESRGHLDVAHRRQPAAPQSRKGPSSPPPPPSLMRRARTSSPSTSRSWPRTPAGRGPPAPPPILGAVPPVSRSRRRTDAGEGEGAGPGWPRRRRTGSGGRGRRGRRRGRGRRPRPPRRGDSPPPPPGIRSLSRPAPVIFYRSGSIHRFL